MFYAIIMYFLYAILITTITSNGARAAIATQNNSIVARQRTSVRFKLAVCGDTGAGGLVVPLPFTAYFSKLAILFGCSLPQQAYA